MGLIRKAARCTEMYAHRQQEAMKLWRRLTGRSVGMVQ